MSSCNVNIAYATQQGSSHKLNNIACEDCVQIVKMNDFAFFGLCDGAGSAENSLLGAEYILEGLCNELQSNTQKYFEDKDSSSLLTEFIEQRLHTLAKQENIAFDSLASTLLFIVVARDKYIMAHIGDGIIIGLDESNKAQVLSAPENGEYSNLTFFTTSSSYKERLHLQRGDVSVLNNGVLLCSDGVQELLFNSHTKEIAPITNTIINWLDEYSENEVSQYLSFNLQENFSKKSGDDLSLIILKGKEDAKL